MSYPPPVDKLLAWGEAGADREWPDYPQELGLGPEHVPDLIRMALDEDLHRADSKNPAVWAPVHAWRALGQLRAEAAIEPLLPMLDEPENDWAMDELPAVYGLIGPPAIEPLKTYLAKSASESEGSLSAAEGLANIAERYPEARGACVKALTGQLKRSADNDPVLNVFLVNRLVDLKAVEAAKVIERAYAAGRMDDFMAEEWEDVQIELGLKEPDAEWHKREEMMQAIVEALAEGKAPPFSIYQRLFLGGTFLEAEAREYCEELVDLFGASPEGQALRQAGAELSWADTMLDFAVNSLGVTPPKMTPADLREILFDLIPRQVMAEPEEAPALIRELHAFWTFLGREFGLRSAPACLKVLDERAERRLEKALGDPTKFGMAKSLIAMGAARGFDVSTEKGIDRWLRTYQAEMAAEMGSPLPGEQGRSVDKARKKKKRKMQKSSRRKNRKK